MGSHGSLLEGLGQRGVGMARPCNVLAGCAILEGQGTLGNHLASVGADNVYTQQSIRLRVRQHLDHALRVQVRLGARVGAEGEGADTVGDVVLLEVLLGLSDPSDLGVGVHDRGNGSVVDVAVALLDVLDDGDSFLFGLVRQHGSEGHITDAADVRELGSVLGVDDDTATLVQLHANVLEAQATGIRATANGSQDDLSFELCRC